MKALTISSLCKISLLLCFFVGLCAHVVADEPSRKYKVGAILALSGQVASLGSYVRRGLELSYSQLPPEERDKISLYFEDDQYDPRLTLSAYRKLVAEHNIDAVIVMGSTPANALVPVTEREGKLLIAIGASDPNIAVGKSLSFIHWVIPPILGSKLADELERRDFKRVAIVISQGSGPVADADAVVSEMEKRGKKDRIIFREQFQTTDVDFKTTILKLKQANVDAVVVVLYPGSLSSFAKQYRTSGAAGELIGMETFEDEAEVKAAAGTLNGTWYVNAADPTEQFVANYKTKYNEHPGWAASNAFDSISLLGQAVDAVGMQNEKVASYLRNIRDFDGASGAFSASGDNRFTLPAAIKRVSEQGFEVVDVAKK